jgi:hypothetical protein
VVGLLPRKYCSKRFPLKKKKTFCSKKLIIHQKAFYTLHDYLILKHFCQDDKGADDKLDFSREVSMEKTKGTFPHTFRELLKAPVPFLKIEKKFK